MSMFTLAIFCLTTSNLPWFMDLPFQVSMQYWSLLNRTLLYHQSYPQLGVVFSLALSLHSLWSYSPLFPVAYLAPIDLGSSSFSVLTFRLFILFMRFSGQGYWSGLPVPSPVDRIFSELSSITHPSCVVLQSMAHSFIELDKAAVVHVISLVNFLWLWFSVCLILILIRRIRGLWKLPDRRDWLRGKLGLVLMGGAMFSKSLIQVFVDGWSCVPSLLSTWGQTMVVVMKIMVTSFKWSHSCTTPLSAPNPEAGHHRPTPVLETPAHSQASLGPSLVVALLLSPGSWWTRFCLCPPRVYFTVLCVFLWSFLIKEHPA